MVDVPAIDDTGSGHWVGFALALIRPETSLSSRYRTHLRAPEKK